MEVTQGDGKTMESSMTLPTREREGKAEVRCRQTRRWQGVPHGMVLRGALKRRCKAWNTEKNTRQGAKALSISSFGVQHRLRVEEMEKQFNKEAKQGLRFAAEAARITDENASSEDRKHTSGESLQQYTAI